MLRWPKARERVLRDDLSLAKSFAYALTGVLCLNVVFSGHEHVYERLKPQNGINYFVLGNSGQLRFHNLRPSGQMERGFDADRDFMVVEIDGDELYFQVISRTGLTIDSGVLQSNTSSQKGSK